jgi:hypothetical protein
MKRRSRKTSIEQPPSGKLDKIESVLAVLFLIALVGAVLFPSVGDHYVLGFGILGNLLILYRGIKKVVEARRRRQQVFWYKEPGILFGLSLLLGALPLILMDNFLSDTVPNASNIKHIAEVVFIGVTLIFLLPAIYFYYKGKMQSHQGSKHIGRLILLGQSRRSGPEPKEARENEGDPVGLEYG